jgi:outer membrane protein assembly factor BamB
VGDENLRGPRLNDCVAGRLFGRLEMELFALGVSMEIQLGRTRRTYLLASALVVLLWTAPGWAVTSKITRQSSSKDLLEGETDNVVVTSRGTIQLGRAAKVLATEFDDVWSVNSIVVSGGTIYIGTSPNGSIYKYRLGKLTKIYPADGQEAAPPSRPALEESDDEVGADVDEDAEPEVVEAEERFTNQHIFAMAVDVAGRLVAGISGNQCKLCRYEAGVMETILEPDDAKYIFAIEVDNVGNMYLGTGPEGKIYALDPSGKVAQLVYDSTDKNILSLAFGPDGFLYAGSDTRGLVYRINPRSKTATVLYDSEEPEISALLFAGSSPSEAGNLYAAATSAKVVQTETKFAAQQEVSGRPEPKSENGNGPSSTDGGMRLQIANTSSESKSESSSRPAPVRKGSKPGSASHIYRINKDGYVTEVFTESAVFLCLAKQNGAVLIGSGNDAQLFAVDADAEREAVTFEDEKAAQITALSVSEKDVYIGTANPARLVLLSPDYATEGTYISDLVDAGQPAKWGKLQIDADIPRDCKVFVSSRSGNVKDVNDPTFSDWTEQVEITEPIQLRCPLGRFCQYKLVLQTKDGQKTPLIREVAVASTVPNLAPKVESIEVERVTKSGSEGVFKISYKAKDENEDKLIYEIGFRRIGRAHWIELKDENEDAEYEWNGKTVEDGRYEVRVVASDERSNTPLTKKTGSRISDPIVVDNTGPLIRKYSVEKSGKAATLKLQITDELSAIGKLEYTIDSNAEWKGTLPDDFVYDTTDESFTIITEDLDPGEHIIALKIADAVGNITYKTFELSVLGE